MRLTLRDYQQASLDALVREIALKKNPLCVLPTGAGKSLVLAALCQAVSPEPVIVLSHVKELLQQDAATLGRLAPEIWQGFFSAGLKEKNARAQVVFGSVQSVYKNLERFTARRLLVIVDEAHLCPRKADAMYAVVFDHFAAGLRVGFTASKSRMDSGLLVDGEGAWFDCIAHEEEAKTLIDRGFLVPLSGVMTEEQANMKGVATRAGEFAQEEAQQAVIRTLDIAGAVASAKKHAAQRKAWLVFAAGVEHAHKVLEELRRQGVGAACVTNETSNEDRERLIAEYKAGEFRALVNVGVLTTGFDAPMTDCIICMRPTQSLVLWQQMLGRGMRLAEGKRNCLLLDYVGNLDRLGGVGVVYEQKDLRDPNQLPKPKEKRAKKVERAEPQLFEASGGDPMTTGALFEAAVNGWKMYTVPARRYPGKEMLIVNYQLQDQYGRAITADTFLCVEYEGAALRYSQRWFTKRGIPREEIPLKARAALTLARACRRPVDVMVRYDMSLKRFLVEHETFADEDAPQLDPQALLTF
jgi:DNA repair protein RadD